MAGLGQAACHEGDHGPQDHGFVAGREAFVLSGGPGYPELALFCVVGDGPVPRWLGIIRCRCRVTIGGVLSVEGVNLRQEDENVRS